MIRLVEYTYGRPRRVATCSRGPTASTHPSHWLSVSENAIIALPPVIGWCGFSHLHLNPITGGLPHCHLCTPFVYPLLHPATLRCTAEVSPRKIPSHYLNIYSN